jgi:hypothetical protein
MNSTVLYYPIFYCVKMVVGISQNFAEFHEIKFLRNQDLISRNFVFREIVETHFRGHPKGDTVTVQKVPVTHSSRRAVNVSFIALIWVAT